MGREAAEGGVKMTTKGMRKDGTAIDNTCAVKYDGKPAPCSGTGSQFDTISMDDAAPNPPESASDFEHDLLSEELRAQVRNLLDGLPTKDRTLLRAVFFEERDKDAVCRDYGVHRAYLRVLLHRAKRRLRDLLPGPNTGTTAPDTFRISGGAL